jgi:hypothetical protein
MPRLNAFWIFRVRLSSCNFTSSSFTSLHIFLRPCCQLIHEFALLFQIFHGKRWEKFNSEKVASLAYARIQGKSSLIAHFQNSSLMNEDKRCRPILFHSDGPNAGDQVCSRILHIFCLLLLFCKGHLTGYC